MDSVQKRLLLKLLEEFGFDAYSLVIFTSRSWSTAKPSAKAFVFWPAYIGINLPHLSERKRKLREMDVKSKMLNLELNVKGSVC